MRLLAKLRHRGDPAAKEPALAPLQILVAERFIAPVELLRRINLPDDVTARAGGQSLHAVILDEFGQIMRRAPIDPPAPGMPGNRISFLPIKDSLRNRFWLFVITAESDDSPALVERLLHRGRELGGRASINLVWDPVDSTFESNGWAEHRRDTGAEVDYRELSDEPDRSLLPPLDQQHPPRGMTSYQRTWREDGVLVLRQFLPDELLDPYIARREQLGVPGGWSSPTPYLQVPELRMLCLYPPLRRVLRELVGEEMMLHLTLTGCVSTERNWHQDDYLNPPFVNGWYAAVWIALGRIDPRSGPFEYVPGSHRWPLLRGDKVRAHMTEAERASTIGALAVNNWPKISERFVVPAIEAEILRREAEPRRFLAEKGDVLIWHARLMHRGAMPAAPELERRALVAHYSGVEHRPDIIERGQDDCGGTFAIFDYPLF